MCYGFFTVNSQFGEDQSPASDTGPEDQNRFVIYVGMI